MMEKRNEMILDEEEQYVKPVMEIIDMRNEIITESWCPEAYQESGGDGCYCFDYNEDNYCDPNE